MWTVLILRSNKFQFQFIFLSPQKNARIQKWAEAYTALDIGLPHSIKVYVYKARIERILSN